MLYYDRIDISEKLMLLSQVNQKCKSKVCKSNLSRLVFFRSRV